VIWDDRLDIEVYELWFSRLTIEGGVGGRRTGGSGIGCRVDLAVVDRVPADQDSVVDDTLDELETHPGKRGGEV